MCFLNLCSLRCVRKNWSWTYLMPCLQVYCFHLLSRLLIPLLFEAFWTNKSNRNVNKTNINDQWSFSKHFSGSTITLAVLLSGIKREKSGGLVYSTISPIFGLSGAKTEASFISNIFCLFTLYLAWELWEKGLEIKLPNLRSSSFSSSPKRFQQRFSM